MPEEASLSIALTTRCQDCGRRETIGFRRGRDLRLPIGWDIWGEEVRCGDCAGSRRRRASEATPAPAGGSRDTRSIPTVLYVATNLESWTPERPEIFARDVSVDGRAFRRLDVEFFAWLAGRVERARAACDGGRVAPEALVQLERRWLRILRWAEAAFGSEAVVGAVARGREPMVYEPPVVRPGGFTLPALTLPAAEATTESRPPTVPPKRPRRRSRVR